MRAYHAGLAVFTTLAAMVRSDALPPADVPVMCAAICGPIVELSSICSPKISKRSQNLVWSAELETPEEDSRPPRRSRQDERRFRGDLLHEKRFSIIVPAPTTFPTQLLIDTNPLTTPSSTPVPQPTPSLQSSPPPAAPPPVLTPSSQLLPKGPSTTTVQSPPPPPPPPPPMSSISSLPLPLSTPPPALPTAKEDIGTPGTTALETSLKATHTSGISPPSVSVSAVPTSMVLQKGSGDGMIGTSNGWMASGSDEEDCVCWNTSFNVAEIAGLCASCIAMEADTQSNMNVVMSACKFPSQTYTPEKDSLASNIQVRATTPTLVWSQNAMVSGAERPTGSVSLGVVIGYGSIVLGVMMM